MLFDLFEASSVLRIRKRHRNYHDPYVIVHMDLHADDSVHSDLDPVDERVFTIVKEFENVSAFRLNVTRSAFPDNGVPTHLLKMSEQYQEACQIDGLLLLACHR